jgi:hypothetical protein
MAWVMKFIKSASVVGNNSTSGLAFECTANYCVFAEGTGSSQGVMPIWPQGQSSFRLDSGFVEMLFGSS